MFWKPAEPGANLWYFGARNSILAKPPACYRSLLGPGPWAMSRECPLGVSLGPFGRRALECPKSVPRASPECPGHLFDTLGTLFGHSGARRPKGPIDTPSDTAGTLRARSARQTPVAGRGGSQLNSADPFQQTGRLAGLCAFWSSKTASAEEFAGLIH